MSLCLLGAVLGFLRYNFKNAQIFMGDTGSLLCGFLIAIFAVEFIEIGNTVNAPNISLAIIFIPLFDTFRVVVCRLIAGKSPFAPDKNHIHHIFLLSGLKQVYTVILLLSINLIAILFTSYFSYLSPTVLFLYLLVYSFSLAAFLEFLKRKK